MTRRPLAVACLAATSLLAAAAVAAAGGDARTAEPGVTATAILIGGTASLSVPASAAVARGAAAYFQHVNARGGVHGRTIRYRVVDDADDPAQTVEATRGLVEQEDVLAIFNSVGTEHNRAVRDYLNARGVPQLFVASGARTFGADAAEFPYTIGFRPSYGAEGRVLGRFVARTRPRATVAVIVEDGDDGRDLLAGFRRGIAGSGAAVVAVERSEATAPALRSRIAALEASGADTLAIVATPSLAARAYAVLRALAWRPFVLTSAVSSAAGVVRVASAGGSGGLAGGPVSVVFLKDPSERRWAEDRAIRLYRTIMRRYARGANVRDVHHVYGMAAAYTLVEVLRKAGRNPSRAAVMRQVRALAVASNPFLLPGVAVRTGPGDGFPIEQMQLQRWERGRWRAFGGLWEPRGG